MVLPNVIMKVGASDPHGTAAVADTIVDETLKRLAEREERTSEKR